MVFLLGGLVTCFLSSLFYTLPELPNAQLCELGDDQQNPSSSLWHKQVFSYFLCLAVGRLLQKPLYNRPQQQEEKQRKKKFFVLAHFLYLILLISLKEKALGWTGCKQSKLIIWINRQHTFSERRRKEFYQTVFLWAMSFDWSAAH